MSLASGPPGINAPHNWYDKSNTTLLVATGQHLETSPRPDPHAKVTEITGWASSATTEDNREDNTGRDGSTPLQSFERTRDLVYSGVVRGRSLEAVDTMRTAMKSGYRKRDGVMRCGPDWFYFGRVVAFDCDDRQSHGVFHRWTYQREFTLGIRQSDPRVYWNTPVLASGLANEATSTFDNQGHRDSNPIFTIHGSGSVVTLENTAIPGNTAGHARLRFEDLPDGTFTVDFNTRRASVVTEWDEVIDVSAQLAPTTDWWDEGKEGVVPGSNTLKVTAEADSTWDYIFYPAA